MKSTDRWAGRVICCMIRIVWVGGLAFSGGCQARAGMLPPRQPLRVFCAGSLILPFTELEKAFEAANPDIDVQNECHGSIQVIRHVTDLHEAIDIVATADQALIPMLMYTANDPDSGHPYANWYIRFAGNRMALAYTPNSRYADEIHAGNWYEILAQPDVKLGLPDPRFDAAGYRALMVLTMTENEYSVNGLYNNLFHSAFTFPVTRFREEGRVEITVPEILEPARASNIVLRGGSIQLLAVLESGDLDYAFEYESVIAQHGLLSIPLPNTINLGSAADAGVYSQVQVKLDFQRFASVQPVFQGEPIGYGITIPSNAPQPELAARYIDFLLSPEGRAVMASANHPLISPILCDQPEQIPQLLQEYCMDE
jgi:molybdate/tungstate transport system substrate-binding protein